MKNADKPINPIYGNDQLWVESDKMLDAFMKQCRPIMGLTKREYFTAMAMQGIIQGFHFSEQYYEAKDIPEIAIKIADETLKQLEKSE